jgi:hypothetical protein
MMSFKFGHTDPAVDIFLETANDLCDEVLQIVFKTDNVDELPFEFIQHKDCGELKFADRKLFEATLAILQAIFLGDIVKEVIQGNRTTLDKLLRELAYDKLR